MKQGDRRPSAKAARPVSRGGVARSADGRLDGRSLGGVPWRTLISAVHPHPSVKINYGTTFLVTDEQGALPLDARDYGLYAADTRFLSRHELRLNGRRPESVASVRLSFRHARWHMIVDGIGGAGGDMREARAALTVDRLVSMHGLHEDLVLQSYGRASLTVLLEIALESDFADLFEVRLKQWQRRDDLNTWWVGPNSLEAPLQEQGLRAPLPGPGPHPEARHHLCQRFETSRSTCCLGRNGSCDRAAGSRDRDAREPGEVAIGHG